MSIFRIVLADDHILFRKGIAAILATRPHVQIVGEAGDGLEAVACARATQPDLILMDVHMPKSSGLEAVKAIKAELPQTQIVMLTVSEDERDLFAAIKNGASGYLLKNLEPEQLYAMLEAIQRGEPAFSGNLAGKILAEFRQPSGHVQPPAAPSNALSPREVQVLEQIVQGATNKEIAAALSIAEDTVKIHLRNILEKLHVHNRIQAAVYAVRQGLVRDGEPPSPTG